MVLNIWFVYVVEERMIKKIKLSYDNTRDKETKRRSERS